ncbi:MAG: prepilin-type N-terminal cleavage/methylation domain-containing protein [Proteobacteria bacterium]|nr:prepilin-type N-terminal cleavage/methylation domain-containing protein [Pseudomonadota bacterium]
MSFKQSHKQKGFTLLEMSIVLLIISIIGVGVITTFSNDTTVEQYKKTQATFNRIRDSMIGFIASNGRLPCPAGPTAARTSSAFGKKQEITSPSPITCDTSTGILSTDVSGGGGGDVLYYGAVPVRDLGLADSDAFDGFGKRIGYVVQKASVNSNATNGMCRPGFKAMDINNNVRYICYAGQASGSVDSATPDITIWPAYPHTKTSSQDAVYVLISHGPNGYGAFYDNAGASGAATRNSFPPSTLYSAEMDNLDCDPATGSCGTSTAMDIHFVSKSRNKYFDDLVMFVNRNDLLSDCNNYSQLPAQSGSTPASSCYTLFGMVQK